MIPFCRVNLPFLFAICFQIVSHALDIVTTDSNALYTIQQSVQDIASHKGEDVQVSLIDSRKITRYLQLGNKGDVLVTSDKTLCQYLSTKGLASWFEYTELFSENFYCMGNGQKVMIILSQEYPYITEQQIYNFAKLNDADVYNVEKNDNLYQITSDIVSEKKSVCGLHSVFLNLGIKDSSLQKTPELIKYFACPLVGINPNSYKTLKSYYAKKHVN